MSNPNEIVAVTVNINRTVLDECEVMAAAIRGDGNPDITLDHFVEGALAAHIKERLALPETAGILARHAERINLVTSSLTERRPKFVTK